LGPGFWQTLGSLPMVTFHATIQSDLTEFRGLTPRILAFLREGNVPPRAAYVARMAVEELVVNVIRYAFDRADSTNTIDVDIRTSPGHVVVRVEDAGRPFDPRTAPSPRLGASLADRTVGGWGIHLVRSMSDELSYERRGGRNIVEVRVSLDPS